MEKKYIVSGVDISKDTFDATLLDLRNSEDAIVNRGQHEKFKNDKKGFKAFLKWMKKLTGIKDFSQVIVCAEDTGSYSLGLANFLHANGVFMWLEWALRIQRSSGITRGKDDKYDSLVLAEYACRYQDRAIRYEPESKLIAALRSLFLHRQYIVEERKRVSTRCKHLKEYKKATGTASKVLQHEQAMIKLLNKQVKECEAEILELVASDDEIKQTYDNITSIKGVGLVNAIAFIVYTNNFKGFDGNPRRIATYWGVAVFKHESGTSVKGKTKTSPLCSRALKSLITEAAKAAILFEPRFRDYYQSLISRGKPHGVAMNNVKNKIIHIVTALAVNNTKFSKTYEEYRIFAKTA